MAKEIERKFLIDHTHPEAITLFKGRPLKIRQGYLKSDSAGVVRVRVMDDQAFLSVKGKNKGLTRDEYEYEVPLQDAQEMLDGMCDLVLEKSRFLLPLDCGLTAEVDYFPALHLFVAEVELPSESADFAKPEWFTLDVSHDPTYYNNNIAARIQG